MIGGQIYSHDRGLMNGMYLLLAGVTVSSRPSNIVAEGTYGLPSVWPGVNTLKVPVAIVPFWDSEIMHTCCVCTAELSFTRAAMPSTLTTLFIICSWGNDGASSGPASFHGRQTSKIYTVDGMQWIGTCCTSWWLSLARPLAGVHVFKKAQSCVPEAHVIRDSCRQGKLVPCNPGFVPAGALGVNRVNHHCASHRPLPLLLASHYVFSRLPRRTEFPASL